MDEPAVRQTFKDKLQPTAEQERALEFVLRRCRELYNAALEERQEAWRRCGVRITAVSQSAQLPAITAVRPEYRDIHSQVLQDVLARLDRAFQAFFRRVKADETPGYPRFRGATRYTSFTFKQFGHGATLDDGRLVLSKIGRVRVRWSRPLEGTPKTVTISREADGWYACFSCAEVPVEPLPLTGRETGLDPGLEAFATLADGSPIENPRLFRVAEMNLRRARADFHHKRALDLVRAYDTIYHEDLRAANMVRNHALAKSIADAGWGQFIAILASKAACAGKRAVAVPPAFTSQACSGCGVLVQKGLSVRWHACPACGASLHRDHNAALNILRLGQSTVGPGMAPQAPTWAAGPSVA